MLVTCAVRVRTVFIAHTGVYVRKQGSCLHEVVPPVAEPVALLHQRETCTYSPICPPLTGSAGTREKASSLPPV